MADFRTTLVSLAVLLAMGLAPDVAAAQQPRLLIVGDSLSAGPQSYARLVAKRHTATVIAKVGAPTSWMLQQVRQADLGCYTHLVVLGGVNDINAHRTVPAIRNLYRMFELAHQHGLRTVAVTASPWRGWPTWSLVKHRNTLRLNEWLAYYHRQGLVDHLVDFYRQAADPQDNQRLHPLYDSRDHLHFNREAHRHLALMVMQEIR